MQVTGFTHWVDDGKWFIHTRQDTAVKNGTGLAGTMDGNQWLSDRN